MDNAPPENAPALPRRPRPATRLPVPPKLGLEDEARIVGDAKIALRRADHERVLDLTHEHAKLFPNGSLVAERLAAEVMALCALDRRSEAKATRALLALRERPALLERVDAACEGPLLPER
ncbi:MAG: hypothetical protein IPG45_20460 [Deltaproteobacteria bacterium]|nr:hypothetical protein [Deltaproteobacteria bacterium]